MFLFLEIFLRQNLIRIMEKQTVPGSTESSRLSTNHTYIHNLTTQTYAFVQLCQKSLRVIYVKFYSSTLSDP